MADLGVWPLFDEDLFSGSLAAHSPDPLVSLCVLEVCGEGLPWATMPVQKHVHASSLVGRLCMHPFCAAQATCWLMKDCGTAQFLFSFRTQPLLPCSASAPVCSHAPLGFLRMAAKNTSHSFALILRPPETHRTPPSRTPTSSWWGEATPAFGLISSYRTGYGNSS